MCNVGFLDRFLRLFLGTILLIMGGVNDCIILAAVGGVLLFTGIIGFCPAYKIFGFKTTCDTPAS